MHVGCMDYVASELQKCAEATTLYGKHLAEVSAVTERVWSVDKKRPYGTTPCIAVGQRETDV